MDLSSVNQLIELVLSPRVLWTILWAGLGILTLTLLTLMGTRWGQARPLSKCVFLSVFAHLLLVGYAYMTDLFIEPIGPPRDVVHVTIVSGDDMEETKSLKERELQPWEKYVPEDTVMPREMSLERETVDTDSRPQRRELDAVPTIGAGMPTELAMNYEVQVEGDQPQPVRSLHDKSTGAKSARIEVPQAERREDVAPAGPTADNFAGLPRRVGQTPTPRRSPASNVPNQALTETPDLQRLADVAMRDDPADAVAASDDLTRATLNRTIPQIAVMRTPTAAPGQVIPQPSSADGQADGNSGQGTATNDPGAGGSAAGASAGNDATHHAADAGPVRTAGPRRLANGRPLPDVYQLRVQADRGEIARTQGGNARTEAAVAAALRWLAENQEKGGHWDADSHGAGRELRVFGHDRQGAGTNADTGITALALLAFMGTGQTHLKGKYRENIQHGLEYLLRSQGRDGNMAGEAKTFAQMYCHGMATLAIAEAYAITGDERLRWWVERAVAYSAAAQNSNDGGWRYRPGDAGDMSQFGWQVMALRTAEMSGIDIPERTRTGMLRFMSSVSSGRHGGLARYRPSEEQPTATMTAESLACRYFLGLAGDDAAVDEAADYLLERRPARERANFYYWYYGTLAMHQVNDARWHRWNEALQSRLIPSQRQDGGLAGTWDPTVTVWGGYGGRVYSTAMAALCLESYYRFSLAQSSQRTRR